MSNLKRMREVLRNHAPLLGQFMATTIPIQDEGALPFNSLHPISKSKQLAGIRRQLQFRQSFRHWTPILGIDFRRRLCREPAAAKHEVRTCNCHSDSDDRCRDSDKQITDQGFR